MSDAPKALIFDVFGTLVDWRTSVAAQVELLLPDLDGTEFADKWRARYDPSMAEIRSGNRNYVALDVLHGENLDYVLQTLGLNQALTSVEKQQLVKAWENLSPWPDTVAALNRLKQTQIIAPCSNGSIGLMTRLAKFAQLPWDCILGADIAKSYKPDPAVYKECCSSLRLEPDQVMMVAAHNNDLAAARKAGLQTAFFPRSTEYGPKQETDLAAEADWDFIGRDLTDLADWMQI